MDHLVSHTMKFVRVELCAWTPSAHITPLTHGVYLSPPTRRACELPTLDLCLDAAANLPSLRHKHTHSDFRMERNSSTR